MEEKRKKARTILLIGVSVLITGAAAIFYWLRSGGYETTDNAQIDGNIISVRSGVTSYVSGIYFLDDQIVEKGQLLFSLDTVELKAKVEEAEAALDYARADLGIARNEAIAGYQNSGSYIESSKAGAQEVIGAKASLVKSQNEYRRLEQLLAIRAATQEQFENAQTALKNAGAAFAKAQNQYKASLSSAGSIRTQAKVKSQQTNLKLALIRQREAELTLARSNFEKAWIRAPFGGRVTRRAVQSGQYVSAGQALCSVIDTVNYWVSANFKETQLSNIKQGQRVEVKIDALPDRSIAGTVESTSGATGAKFSLIPADNATGNFIKIVQRVPVRIRLDMGSKKADEGLFPGLSAFVKVKID